MASLSIAEQSNLIQWLFSTRTFQRFQAKELLVYVLVYWKTDDTKYIEKMKVYSDWRAVKNKILKNSPNQMKL